MRLVPRNSGKFRPLCFYLNRALGRDLTGQIVARCRGGGVKRLYRFVDYWRRGIRQTGYVERVEYNPYTTGFIALVKYGDSTRQYILAPEGLRRGGQISNGQRRVRLDNVGSSTALKFVNPGTLVYNVELIPGKGGQFIRAAGTYGKVLRGDTEDSKRIRLPSGTIRYFSKMCAVSVGRVSNV